MSGQNIHPRRFNLFFLWRQKGGAMWRWNYLFFCSYHVFNLLQYVANDVRELPNGFQMMFPKGVPNNTSLYLISFAQKNFLSPIYMSQREALQLHIEIVLLGNLRNFCCYFGGGWIKLAHYEKQKKNLGSNLFNE